MKRFLNLLVSVMIIVIITEFFNIEKPAFGRNPDESDSIRYSQTVHMYVCIEALKLLKDRFPTYNFSEFDIHIGNIDNTGTRPWQMGRITTGAYREDTEDVVFGIRGPFDFYVSTSHFWNADNRIAGDHSLTTLDIFGVNMDFPNAFTKIKRYEDGNWKEWNGSGYGARKFIDYNTTSGFIYRFSLHNIGLINFYKTRRIWLESYVNHLGQTNYVRANVTVSNEIRNIVCWEILGRMLHLVQDLTIAAHVHNDVHANVPFIGGDCYHDFIDEGGFSQFNWQSAKQNGGFINPYGVDEDPLRYIFYTASQLADHFPSGPECLEIPQQHLGNNNLPGGSYPMIENYYNELGTVPLNIPDVVHVGRYCFNHAIRASASLMYWFGVETNLISTDPYSMPAITGFSKNLPDFNLFRGETLVASVNATGVDLNYDWFIKVCDTNSRCNENIYGINHFESGNSFFITNNNFRNSWTCTRYDSLCNIGNSGMPYERPLSFKVGVKAYNQFGSDTKYFYPSEFFNPFETIRPLPPVSGCPYLLIKTEYKYEIENNLLYKNNFEFNLNRDSEDLYLLKNIPTIDYENRVIKIALKEMGTDKDYFDQVSLIAVDHPVNTTAGVDINNNIVIYQADDVVSPSNAELSGKDVTSNLKYDTSVINSVKGYEKDVLRLKFPDYNLSDHFDNDVTDSVAVIIDPYHYDAIPDPHAVKREAGEIVAFNKEGVIKTNPMDFAIRELRHQEIIPLFGSNGISSAEISWKRNFDLSYAAAAKIYYGGFIINNLELSEAEDLKKGNVLQLINKRDSFYLESDSSTFVELKFKINSIEPPLGMKRNYVFVISGRYVRTGNDSLSGSHNLKIPDSKSDNKLNLETRLTGIYPNPFNSTAVINYSVHTGLHNLTKIRIDIYDVLGKLKSTVVNEHKKDGNYSVNFNSENLPSGVYYCVLKTGWKIEGKRMIILK